MSLYYLSICRYISPICLYYCLPMFILNIFHLTLLCDIVLSVLATSLTNLPFHLNMFQYIFAPLINQLLWEYFFLFTRIYRTLSCSVTCFPGYSPICLWISAAASVSEPCSSHSSWRRVPGCPGLPAAPLPGYAWTSPSGTVSRSSLCSHC